MTMNIICMRHKVGSEDMFLSTVTSTVPGGRIKPLHNEIQLQLQYNIVAFFIFRLD